MYSFNIKNLIKKSIFHKYIYLAFVFIFTCFSFIACSPKDANSIYNETSDNSVVSSKTGLSDKKIAVVYFSAFDDVENAANVIAERLSADLIEINPKVPYTEEDLNIDDENSRMMQEARLNLFEEETEEFVEDHMTSFGIEPTEASVTSTPPAAKELPAIDSINVRNYDVIFLGYPIWQNDAPKVVYTFLKDLKDKVLVPFTYSKDADITTSEEIIGNYVDESVEVMLGLKFTGVATESEISNWLNLININV